MMIGSFYVRVLKQLTFTIQNMFKIQILIICRYFNVGTTFKMQRIANVKSFTPLDKSMAIQNEICQ